MAVTIKKKIKSKETISTVPRPKKLSGLKNFESKLSNKKPPGQMDSKSFESKIHRRN